MELPDLFYGSIAITPVIVALVALFKKVGMSSDFAPWAVVILTALFFGLIVLTNVFPDIREPMTVALNVGITLLATFGLYDVQKNVTTAVRG